MQRILGFGSVVAVLGTAVAPVAGAAPAVTAVSAGRDRAVVAVDDDSLSIGGERAWPLGLHLAAAETPAAALRRSIAGALVRAGAPVEVAQAAMVHDESWTETYQWTEVVGDFDGDGGRDVLVSTMTFGSDSDSLELEALRGRDGTSLWRSEHDGYATPIPADVGDPAGAGVYVVSYAAEGVGALFAGVGQLETRITALGGEGQAVWERTYSGKVIDSIAGTVVDGAVTNVDVFQAVDGGATDLLVTSLDVMSVAGQRRTTATADVLDGRDGAVATTMQESTEEEAEPIAVPGPNLDTAAGDDLLFIVAPYYDEAPQNRLVARSSGDGSELWRREDVTVNAWSFLRSPGDMTGDGRAEILTSSMYGRATVLDGADGSPLWRRLANVAYPAGDIDGDGLGDVALVRFAHGWRAYGMDYYETTASGGGIPPLPTPIAGGAFATVATDVAVGSASNRRLGVIWRAVNADGEPVQRQVVSLRRPRTRSSTVVQFERLGDVDGDSRPDVHALVVVADLERETVRSQRRVISGRTGQTRWAPPLTLEPLHGAVDGDGADVITRGFHNGRRTVEVRDGRDGSLLWDLRGQAARGVGGATAADMTGDGRAEVVLGRGNGDLTVRDGRDGRVLWSMEREQAMPYAVEEAEGFPTGS